MVLLAVLALALAAEAPAGDTAKKEPAKSSRPGKVYTNQDLLTAKGNVTAPGTSATSPSDQAEAGQGEKATSGEPEKEPTEEEKREQLRATIRAQIDEQRELIEVRRKDIERMQQELGDFSGPTFSVAGVDGRPVGRRGSLMGFVQEAQGHIEKARETIAALEEQARRQGIKVQVP